MNDDAKAIAIITDSLEGNSFAVTAANHSVPVLAVEEFASEFNLTDENILKHLNAAKEKSKVRNGNKANSPKLLAPEVWEQMKNATEYNNTFNNIW